MQDDLLTGLDVQAAEVAFATGTLPFVRRIAIRDAAETSLVPFEDGRLVGEVLHEVVPLRDAELSAAHFLAVSQDYTVAIAEMTAAVLADASGFTAAPEETALYLTSRGYEKGHSLLIIGHFTFTSRAVCQDGDRECCRYW